MDKILNKYCPRTGKRVTSDSLTYYRGYIVGFFNPSCRDDFANNKENCPKDTNYFDLLIKETQS